MLTWPSRLWSVLSFHSLCTSTLKATWGKYPKSADRAVQRVSTATPPPSSGSQSGVPSQQHLHHPPNQTLGLRLSRLGVMCAQAWGSLSPLPSQRTTSLWFLSPLRNSNTSASIPTHCRRPCFLFHEEPRTVRRGLPRLLSPAPACVQTAPHPTPMLCSKAVPPTWHWISLL